MSLTEQEASEKWCPFMRKDQNWFPNGDPPGGTGPECMGSSCMAWRWDGPTPKVADKDMADFTDPKNPRRWTTQKDAPHLRKGHCGLVSS